MVWVSGISEIPGIGSCGILGEVRVGCKTIVDGGEGVDIRQNG
jgi:hypothetical protein